MADSRVKGAPYALRITQRKEGRAAILYGRQADPEGRDRLQRLGALGPLAYSAALPMLRQAVGVVGAGLRPAHPLEPGAYYPLDAAWGPRIACYALVAAGLRDGERLLRAAENLRHAAPDQAAWWLGLLLQEDEVRPRARGGEHRRAVRALRILTEAVQ